MDISICDALVGTLFLPIPTDRVEQTIDESLLSAEDKELVKKNVQAQIAAESFDVVLQPGCRGLVTALIKPSTQRPLFPWRNVCGDLHEIMEKYRLETITTDARLLSAEQCGALVDGLLLSDYKYKKDTTKNTLAHAIAFLKADSQQQAVIEKSRAQSEAANKARFMADSPANLMTPEIIAQEAVKLAERTGLKLTVLDEEEMRQQGMNALLAVSQGSAHEARLICLEYRHPEAEKTIAMVGKGLTFDAGGVSLKPSRGMCEMKYDKSGGTAVFYAMEAISKLQPKINVIGVVPSSENVTGANAVKPGDVITACNGKSIEVINTDAEGRLILCDALAWTVDKFKPAQIVNIATLTGAVIRSLGRGIAAVAGNDQSVCDQLIEAGLQVDERLWQVPILDVHEELLKSKFADLANVMDDGEASLVNGSVFLREFVADTPWAAIDIGGTAWRYRGASYIKGTGASGFGCRLLTQWALNESKS